MNLHTDIPSRAEIDVPHVLVQILGVRKARLREISFRHQLPMSPWIMFPEWGPDAKEIPGALASYSHLYREMKAVLAQAGLPSTFSPHTFRHTYISRALAAGESPAYVQRQARHSSISMTVDRYGSWLPHQRSAAIDKLAKEVS